MAHSFSLSEKQRQLPAFFFPSLWTVARSQCLFHVQFWGSWIFQLKIPQKSAVPNWFPLVYRKILAIVNYRSFLKWGRCLTSLPRPKIQHFAFSTNEISGDVEWINEWMNKCMNDEWLHAWMNGFEPAPNFPGNQRFLLLEPRVRSLSQHQKIIIFRVNSGKTCLFLHK